MLRALFSKPQTIKCEICGNSSELISKALKVCSGCIRKRPEEALTLSKKAHTQSRRRFHLPSEPPKKESGVNCRICGNGCRIPKGGKGFCGLRVNEGGRLKHLAGTPNRAIVEWYHDTLPTNCVGDWVCPGGTGCGYPDFSYTDHRPEFGYKNLAVFYGACSFDCLFCQNWHYRLNTNELSPVLSANELAEKVDEKTACICYFGGDPGPQITHAIKTSRIALEKNKNRILRICWESNGNLAKGPLKKIAEMSIKSGGCIKFDLKAWDESLNMALCGISNEQTLENFEFLSEITGEREEPPFLVASTLLIPGYVEVGEVKKISDFIASLNPKIPYSLLAFYPQFEMEDMPVTTRRQAEECMKATKNAGLERVRIGNVHLLN